MSVNISTESIDDPFYRYKRPVAVVKNMKNNTTILNLDAIAKALNTQPKYILHWIKCNKSIAINGDVIKSKLSTDDIETLIDEFIAYMVCCRQCDLPELSFTHDPFLHSYCKSCGYNEDFLENKFTKFIYNDMTK